MWPIVLVIGIAVTINIVWFCVSPDSYREMLDRRERRRERRHELIKSGLSIGSKFLK